MIGAGGMWEMTMRTLKALALTTAALALSLSAAAACDDLDEELALQAAMESTKLARASAEQPGDRADAATPGAEGASSAVAAAEPAAGAQTVQAPAATVRQ